MNDIKAMFELDFQSLLLALIAFMAGFVALKKIFSETCGWLGLETKFMREKREEKEDIDFLKKHSNDQDKKIDGIVEAMNRLEKSLKGLSDKIDHMQEREDQNEAARLKDRISESYRYYHSRWKITQREKETLKELIAAYSKYSDNSFVHSLVEVELEQWPVVEEDISCK